LASSVSLNDKYNTIFFSWLDFDEYPQPTLVFTAMNEQLREFLIAPRFVPFRVRLNNGSVYEVPSKEHAWFGTGRSGLLFVENDSGAASVIQIRNIVAVETSQPENP
jgi:hypothetical protein